MACSGWLVGLSAEIRYRVWRHPAVEARDIHERQWVDADAGASRLGYVRRMLEGLGLVKHLCRREVWSRSRPGGAQRTLDRLAALTL